MSTTKTINENNARIWECLNAIAAAADLATTLSKQLGDLDPNVVSDPRFDSLRRLFSTATPRRKNQARGARSAANVFTEAYKAMQSNPRLSRRALAKFVAPRVGLKTEHTEDLLEQLGLPNPRRQK